MGYPSIVPFATNELLPDGPRPDGQTYMGGPLTASRGVVFHVNAGNGDPRNWWTNPTNPSVASAHLQIMKSGELRQYVPLDRVAWAEVAGNGSWHSVETEGFPGEPLTPAQFETFAHLLAWGHGACGWPLQVTDDPNGAGLGTHEMGGAAWGGHACPGPVRAAQRPALTARAQQLLAPAPAVQGEIAVKYQATPGLAALLGAPTTPESPCPDGTGRYNHFALNNGSIYWTPTTGAFSVRGAIAALWASLGWEKSPLGYPTSDEFGVDGYDRYGKPCSWRQSNFEHGHITWTPAGGAVAHVRP